MPLHYSCVTKVWWVQRRVGMGPFLSQNSTQAWNSWRTDIAGASQAVPKSCIGTNQLQQAQELAQRSICYTCQCATPETVCSHRVSARLQTSSSFALEKKKSRQDGSKRQLGGVWSFWGVIRGHTGSVLDGGFSAHLHRRNQQPCHHLHNRGIILGWLIHHE